MTVATSAPRPAVPAQRLWRWSIEQYHAMIRAGVLTEDDPVELLEGWLVANMPKNPAHRVSTKRVRRALEARVPADWYVDSQEPITTADSEPEPDVMVVRGRTEDYMDRHPGPGDLALVVEIADTTLQSDRTLKKQLYARAGIPAYWIVNLAERRIEVYTQPSGASGPPDFGQRDAIDPQGVVPLLIDGVEVARIPADALLPPGEPTRAS